MLSNFKGTGKSWDMFPGTPLVLVQQLGSTLPIKGPHQPQTCTKVGVCCSSFPRDPRHPDPCSIRSAFPFNPTCLLTTFLPPFPTSI